LHWFQVFANQNIALETLTLFEVGENQLKDPQNGLQIPPNFVTFPISIEPI